MNIREVSPALATDPVTDDPDDPAVWINRRDPAKSLLLGTNKVRGERGALVVFGLDGKTRQTVAGIDRPNNVDIEYGLSGIDVAVVTERMKNRLRVFEVNERGVTDIGAIDCCPEPMGIGLYRRPTDGAIFAIVAPKGRPASPRDGYLFQYRLTRDASGQVSASLVRRFGQFSGTKEIEAVVVDDELGFVYYADEGAGIRKYRADPDSPDANRELSVFGTQGYQGDREGLAIYCEPKGRGYLISTDQQPVNTAYKVYDRQDNRELFVFRGGADTTDGIEAVSANLGPQFPHGLFVAMNSGGKNFLIYRWHDIVRR